MSFLRAEIDRMRDEWQEMCRDTELGTALVTELWVSATTRARRRV